MNVRPLLILVALAATATACQSEEACVVPSGNEVICTLQKKSVCEQGKGHKFLGGDCPTAGYAKKTADGVWEKK